MLSPSSDKIKEQALINVLRNFINIGNLMSLSLSFESPLTRDGFKKFNESLENLVTLKQICLDLSE